MAKKSLKEKLFDFIQRMIDAEAMNEEYFFIQAA